MVIVGGQQHLFSTHERVFLWKCQSVWDRKCTILSQFHEAPSIYVNGKDELYYRNHWQIQSQVMKTYYPNVLLYIPCIYLNAYMQKQNFFGH